MKEILQNRTRLLLIVSPILVGLGLIFSYGAIAKKPKNAEPKKSASHVSRSRPPRAQTRSERANAAEDGAREYLNEVFGVNRNPDADAKAAAARALTPSPFLKGRKFMPRTPNGAPPSWTAPIPPPIRTNRDEYGHNASTRVQALAVNPSNPAVVYTGSWGGLAKSANAGDTWQYLSDSWDSQDVSAIAIDPDNPDQIFVGSGKEDPNLGVGLYHSADGGANWTNLPGNMISGPGEFVGSVIRGIVIDSNSGDIYVANGLGPCDGGATSAPCGLWRSTDGGSTWTAVGPRSYRGVYDVAIDTSTTPSSTLYTAQANDTTTGGGVYKSVNSGNTWNRIYEATWNGKYEGGKLSVAGSEVYLLDLTDHILRKFPGNTAICDPDCSWTPILTLCSGAHCGDGQLSPNMFAVNPSDPSIIFADEHNEHFLFRTDDGGATNWELVGFGKIHLDQRVIAFAPSDPSVLYEGNDGGVVRGTRHGRHWTNLNTNFPGALTYGVALSRDGTMIAGTQDCGVLLSDGGAPWDVIWGGDSAHNLIDPYDSNTAYFTNQRAETFMRYDRSNPHDPFTDIHPEPLCNGCEDCSTFPTFTMNPLISEHLVAACQTVVRSLNKGTKWKMIGRGPLAENIPGNPPIINTVTAAREAPSNPNVIYAVVSRWEVWVTIDANLEDHATWTQITGPNWQGNINAIAVDPSDPNTVYLASQFGVLKTNNMGDKGNWDSIPATQDLVCSDIVIDPNNSQHIFVASQKGVFASFNSGDTWNELGEGIPKGMYIHALSFNQFSRQLAAATFGRGVYILDLDDVPPTVSITSPTSGDKLLGTVTISAVASDNHGVAGVQFKIDGGNLGAEDTSPPYSISWNTAGWGGTRTLTALARDPANNTVTSVGVTVSVSEEIP